MCLSIPGEIISVAGQDMLRTAQVRFGSVINEVKLAYVPEASPGDFVLVHAGSAIRLVDQLEAAQLLDIFTSIGDSVEPEL